MLFWIPTGLEVLFKVRKALFKCVFLRVCSKLSYCFAFLIMKSLFTPAGWHEVKCVTILKGFGRLVVGFDVHKNHIGVRAGPSLTSFQIEMTPR